MSKTGLKYNNLDDLNKKSAETILSQIYNKENVSLTEEDAAEILVKWNPTIIIENDVMRSFSKDDRRTIDIKILNRIQIKTNSK